jgi:hypothetical protein
MIDIEFREEFYSKKRVHKILALNMKSSILRVYYYFKYDLLKNRNQFSSPQHCVCP